jgi:EpsI family protein
VNVESNDLKEAILKKEFGLAGKGRQILFLKRTAVQLCLIAAAFVFVYAKVFYDLVQIWWTRDDYAHGFLIVPISLYLVWMKRRFLRALSPDPAIISGLFLVLCAGVLFLIGEAGGVISFGGVSLIGMLCGLVLLLWGWCYLKILALPIFYLIFTVPVLDVVLGPLHWPFQLLTAKMGVLILQQFGLAVLLQQQYIVLPNITLEVARLCSGVSYLVSIVAIGLPLAYVVLSRWWSRIILVTSAVAIGVAGNWVRVVFIGIWAYWGGAVLHGPFHIFQGMFVAWVGFMVLFAGAWGLSKIDRPKSISPVADANTSEPPSQDAARWQRAWSISLVALLLLGSYSEFLGKRPIDLKMELEALPIQIDGWTGVPARLEKAAFRIKEADAELYRTYRNQEGREIHLYVAYLKTQNQGKEIVNYRTGFFHKGGRERPIEIDPRTRIMVNAGYWEEEHRFYPVLFWYDINGEVFSDRYQAKIYGTLDAILRGRSNGAFVLLYEAPSAQKVNWNGEDAFVRALYPSLRLSLP